MNTFDKGHNICIHLFFVDNCNDLRSGDVYGSNDELRVVE